MKKFIAHVIAVIVALMGAFGAALTNAAPPDEVGGFKTPAFASLLGVLLYVLCLYVTNFFRINGTKCVVMAVFCTGAFFILTLAYYHQLDRLTFQYNDSRIVRAESYTERALEYKRLNPGVTDELLYQRDNGEQEKIWTRESLQFSRLTLISWYFAVISAFFVALFPIALGVTKATGDD